MNGKEYLGTISMYAGTRELAGTKFCDGTLLAIAGYTSLFQCIGALYGGDGRVNFALPDLRARSPMGAGQGDSLTPRSEGQRVGAGNAAVYIPQMDGHTHDASFTADVLNSKLDSVQVSQDCEGTIQLACNSQNGGQGPLGGFPGRPFTGYTPWTAPGAATSHMAEDLIDANVDTVQLRTYFASGPESVTVSETGGGEAVKLDTLSPYLGVNYLIRVEGDLPPSA